MSTAPTHLTGDEIEFLQRLFAEVDAGPTGTAAEGSRRLTLDAGRSDAEVLASLIGAEQLTLTAERDGLQFSFEVALARPPSGHPVSLQIGYPRIVDRQGHGRAARVQPAMDEATLVAIDGARRNATVRDISASGLSVTEPSLGHRRRNERIRLHLRLDGDERANLQGRIVRVENARRGGSPCRTLGIEFEHADPGTRAILDRFVFRHHPTLQGAERPRS